MKPSTAKTKGRETENKYVEWLIDHGVPNAERRRLLGVLDKGDISGWVKSDGSDSVVVEVKSGAKLDIAGWLKELECEISNAGGTIGFVVVRPKGKPNVDDWFVLMPLPEHHALMERAGFLP